MPSEQCEVRKVRKYLSRDSSSGCLILKSLQMLQTTEKRVLLKSAFSKSSCVRSGSCTDSFLLVVVNITLFPDDGKSNHKLRGSEAVTRPGAPREGHCTEVFSFRSFTFLVRLIKGSKRCQISF